VWGFCNKIKIAVLPNVVSILIMSQSSPEASQHHLSSKVSGTVFPATATPTNVIPSLSPCSYLHIDNACNILQFFNLSFHCYFRYIICKEKLGFISLAHLKTHLFGLGSSKKANAGQRNVKLFNTVIDHISSIFQIPKNQTANIPSIDTR
jgi:hypothetical protein